ncbi:hypothetical protein SG34_016035 [Thalassomonas viridans]|uniref:Jacalin-type lectin domain-containing protein n=1 Tax=Thalassomonas viridans TaxID=137584 RepID=A0AAE9YX82_9GAMM|nr:jacalin-like lectin [Thalassomonas viridans]WDE02951.1 hypothetical protein SG34_016035 [Thalassomonas viridans]
MNKYIGSLVPGKIGNLASVLIGAVFLGGVAAPAVSEVNTGDEQVTRLKLQGTIDAKAPLSKTLWAGAHNAYASKQWDGDYNDVNQWYEPKKLMERGIRLMEFDVYPESTDFSSVMMCHLGAKEWAICNADAKPFTSGLEQIESYIEDNPHDVIMLKLEVYDSKYPHNGKDFRERVADKIENKVGDIVFKPEDWGYGHDECASLPVQSLTKEDVLAAGKNLIVITQIPRDKDLCNYHGKADYREWVWIGADKLDAAGGHKASQAYEQGKASSCDTFSENYELGNLNVALDSSHEYTADKIWLSGASVQEIAECGAQILEAALVEANDTDIDTPLIDLAYAIQIKDYVWSWNSEPLTDTKGCAYVEDGRIFSADCSTSKQYVCVNEDRQWLLAGDKGAWENGFEVCESKGEGYTFAMPYNARENAELREKVESGSAWVNYFKVIDGIWLSNQNANDYKTKAVAKVEAKGFTEGGDAFDAINILHRKLLVNNINVKSVALTAGSSGYLDSIEVCYGFTQTISPATADTNELCEFYGKNGKGGSSDSLTLNTQSGEYLHGISYCYDDSEDRITRLLAYTNKGNAVEIGKCSGTAHVAGAGDGGLFGFHGTHGDVIKSLGIYTLDGDIIMAEEYYDTGWLDTDNPGGTADGEEVTSLINRGHLSASCKYSDVVGYFARVVGTKLDSSLTGDIFGDPDINNGFVCKIADNGGERCEDYEVRYFFNKDCSL